MKTHHSSLSEISSLVTSNLGKISIDIENALQKMSKREKLINNQFELLLTQYRALQASGQDVEGIKVLCELQDRTWRASRLYVSFMTGCGGLQVWTWGSSSQDLEGFKTVRKLHDRMWRASSLDLGGFKSGPGGLQDCT
ncbi:unnamed protein product [Nesidiocoris tenuis]|uniref:Uncharacterized protein n=1 Tax=Nesidiocoris tenuis TaxID=355587 RepID=A0A6H5GM10_9HEMI|nr:unnamed protein product [Nesidiocoris tenuis]